MTLCEAFPAGCFSKRTRGLHWKVAIYRRIAVRMANAPSLCQDIGLELVRVDMFGTRVDWRISSHNDSKPTKTAKLEHFNMWKPKIFENLPFALVLVSGLSLGGCLVLMSGCEMQTTMAASTPNQGAKHEAGEAKSEVPAVDVVHPQAGGVDRICVQPGTVEPYESADLYAKVSGFLAEQFVDIGDHVKKGQILAKISVPEFEKQVEKDRATVAHSEAKIKQMEAHVQAAIAQADAAQAQVDFAKADLQAKTAYREFRAKQFHRIKDLRDQKAVDDRLVDEKEDQLAAALSAENAALASIATAQRQSDAARANVIRAQADLEDAHAELNVARAELAKSEVLLNYTIITSPYTGVITHRQYFPGDFIRSAEDGPGKGPLLSVERTDLMRIVIQVPDRDVPFVDPGDQARVEIDALYGRTYDAKVSRCAFSEDGNTRTMRTEVDVPNTDGALRRGMYGRSTLILEPASKSSVTVPSTALVERTGSHEGKLRIVRNGHLQFMNVKIGTDDGVRVEVTEGLMPDDEVVVRTNTPVADGDAVTARQLSVAKSGGH